MFFRSFIMITVATLLLIPHATWSMVAPKTRKTADASDTQLIPLSDSEIVKTIVNESAVLKAMIADTDTDDQVPLDELISKNQSTLLKTYMQQRHDARIDNWSLNDRISLLDAAHKLDMKQTTMHCAQGIASRSIEFNALRVALDQQIVPDFHEFLRRIFLYNPVRKESPNLAQILTQNFAPLQAGTISKLYDEVIRDVELSQDGSYLWSLEQFFDDQYKLVTYDCKSRQMLKKQPVVLTEDDIFFKLSSDGKKIVFCRETDSERSFNIYDVETKSIERIPIKSAINQEIQFADYKFTHDGAKLIIAVGYESDNIEEPLRSLYRYDMATKQVTSLFEQRPFHKLMFEMSLSNTGRYLALIAATSDEMGRRLSPDDSGTPHVVLLYDLHQENPVEHICYEPHEHYHLMTPYFNADDSALFIDQEDGRRIQVKLPPQQTLINTQGYDDSHCDRFGNENQYMKLIHKDGTFLRVSDEKIVISSSGSNIYKLIPSNDIKPYYQRPIKQLDENGNEHTVGYETVGGGTSSMRFNGEIFVYWDNKKVHILNFENLHAIKHVIKRLTVKQVCLIHSIVQHANFKKKFVIDTTETDEIFKSLPTVIQKWLDKSVTNNLA